MSLRLRKCGRTGLPSPAFSKVWTCAEIDLGRKTNPMMNLRIEYHIFAGHGFSRAVTCSESVQL
jgi:hypothetical protein